MEELKRDLGILPLPLAGVLHFSDTSSGEGCDSDLRAGSFTMSCTANARGAGDLHFSNTDASATRSEALPSVFGDLGGRWSYQNGSASCSVTFENNTITADCTDAGDFTGAATVTVDGDRISGSTDAGIEFTAQRR